MTVVSVTPASPSGVSVSVGGPQGANAYLYIAYASDDEGTNFSLDPSDARPFIAALHSTSAIPEPDVDDFDGLWVRFKGGFDFKSGWSSATLYALSDVVTHDNSTWYALAASTNVEPGTDPTKWHLILDGSAPVAEREAAEDAQEAAEDARDAALLAKTGAETAAGTATTQAGIATTKAGEADDAADLSAAWAEGTLPGGAGTKSSKEHAEDSEASAELAADWAEGTLPGGAGTKSAKEWAQYAESVIDLDAESIEVTPAGNIAATDVQAALEELDSEKAPKGALTGSGLTMTTARLLGRTTASTGAVEELTAANVKSFLDIAADPTESAARLIEIATQVEADAGTDDARAITPKKLAAFVDKARPANIVETVKTNTFTTSSTSFVDVTGLSATITPSSPTSRILVLVAMAVGAESGKRLDAKLLRGSTDLAVGDAAGSRLRALGAWYPGGAPAVGGIAMMDIDAPATTSPVTYKVQIRVNASGNVHVNRNDTDTNDNTYSRYASSILAMEIV